MYYLNSNKVIHRTKNRVRDYLIANKSGRSARMIELSRGMYLVSLVLIATTAHVTLISGG